jgi:tRNA (cytidine/uridine-2'-O-)-methyltransferase
MVRVLLWQPEIPPNTGNIIRLCANTGAELHLIGPLGFDLDDAKLRRAGLDYHEFAEVRTHDSLEDCLLALGAPRVFAFTTRARQRHDQARFEDGDALLFGPESRGLPGEILDSIPGERQLRIPMREAQRSLNLSNAVAVAIYEAWRQLGYPGAVP